MALHICSVLQYYWVRDKETVLIQSSVIAPSAGGISYCMVWHHVWAISASITADKLWMHPISHRHGRVSGNAYYAVSGILLEESVAGLSCPIYVQISFLYLLMWTASVWLDTYYAVSVFFREQLHWVELLHFFSNEPRLLKLGQPVFT